MQVAYKLQLPEGSPVHLVFHVSFLKKFVGGNNTACINLPPVADDGIVLLEPQHILDTRWVKQENKFNLEHLFQWRHLLVEEAT